MKKPKKLKIAHLEPEQRRQALIDGMREYANYKTRTRRSATMFLKSMGITIDKSGNMTITQVNVETGRASSATLSISK